MGTALLPFALDNVDNYSSWHLRISNSIGMMVYMDWTLILSIGVPIFAAIIMGVVGWLLKTAIEGLQKTDTRIEGKVDRIEAFTKAASNSIVEIQTLLGGKGFVINQKLAYAPGSPLKLTEYGETLMKESGFYEILKNNSAFFVNLVKAKNPQTNYDIQECSMAILKELAHKNNELVIPLKNYSFNKGLSLEIILNSAGIVLRDEVMKELNFNDGTLEKTPDKR